MGKLTDKAMKKLQEKWESLPKEKLVYLRTKVGIRSSQIYAVIDLLVDLGIIKPEHLEG